MPLEEVYSLYEGAVAIAEPSIRVVIDHQVFDVHIGGLMQGQTGTGPVLQHSVLIGIRSRGDVTLRTGERLSSCIGRMFEQVDRLSVKLFYVNPIAGT